jgi:hypothetical protein
MIRLNPDDNGRAWLVESEIVARAVLCGQKFYRGNSPRICIERVDEAEPVCPDHGERIPHGAPADAKRPEPAPAEDPGSEPLCPECGAVLVAATGRNGVRCTRCEWWFTW